MKSASESLVNVTRRKCGLARSTRSTVSSRRLSSWRTRWTRLALICSVMADSSSMLDNVSHHAEIS